MHAATAQILRRDESMMFDHTGLRISLIESGTPSTESFK